MRVSNMTSAKGNDVPNQFEITGVTIKNPKDRRCNITGTMFQSYSSNIAFRSYGDGTFLDEQYWDYSVTTGRYRNQFLGEDIAHTRARIASGEYKLVNLNK